MRNHKKKIMYGIAAGVLLAVKIIFGIEIPPEVFQALGLADLVNF